MIDSVYEYKKINVTLEHPPTVEAAANRWALMGWRTVAVIPAQRTSEGTCILVERPKSNYKLISDEDFAELQRRAENPHG